MATKASGRSTTGKSTSAKQTDVARDGNRRTSGNGSAEVTSDQLNELLAALKEARDGDFSARMSRRAGILGEISRTFNELVEMNAARTKEFTRVARVIGREGRMHERMARPTRGGQWAAGVDAVNSMIDDLVRPTTEIARVMEAVAEGDLSQKMALKIEGQPVKGEFLRIGTAVNSMVDQLSSFSAEVTRVAREVGTEGKLGGQAKVRGVSGTWKDLTDSVNFMAGNLTAQVRDIAQVTTAVARGDLSQKITVDVKGEILELKNTINTMVDQLSSFADEVTRVAREVGTEGKLGGQAQVKGVSGTWKDLTDNVNFMAGNLTSQVRNIAQVATAVANGDLSRKITVEAKGEVAALADVINSMTDTLRDFADEVTRVAREVGTEGKLGGQAKVEGVAGTWKDLTDNVNFMAGNLTSQVRNIAQVATAVANGNLSRKITVEAKGEVAALADTINSMTETLQAFADEVTRVAREVGTEGNLGGQAKVEGVAGTWKDLTDSVNFMAGNLTDQVRDIAQVTTAVANGDLSQKITVDVKGEILELKNTINTMVDQLSSFADEVTRVAREVGTEGKLGGQARVEGVSGTWKGLTQNVNFMADNLTDQVRNIAQVATAVATGDLSKKITVDAHGEILELKDTLNTMVDQLSSFADEVTRVAREVGTEGNLGGQARVEGVSGTWRDLTDNVNFMAGNLTDQVRNIAQVTTAVANGDLSQKITVDVKGEILELKNTINTMVDQLSSFADEVTRVAREVGTEGKLGGQARVEGASGTWKNLTENVNQLAGNLTTQVRAIAEVATAVTQGDLTREITVAAQGEVAQLKDKINEMITNLADTTKRNEEQDWLKTNLAKISGMMQGQRDLQTVSRLIMSELTPTVSSHHGAFFLAESPRGNGGMSDDSDVVLRLKASYGYKPRETVANEFRLGEGLVGQAALEKRSILLTDAPEDYIKISSGLGETAPASIIVVPVTFEDQVLGVIELGSLRPFSDVDQTFLDQLMETLGVVLNTIMANMRTEELLEESQRLTRELQSQSEELQTQQEELQQTNEELQEKAALLAEQNRNIEIKNQEIELARVSLEEKAQQLALSSRYKSEFLANMSHELRTPLNSLLILAKLLADNDEQNLTEKQIEFADTIHNAGADLLALINDILDLSKVEAGKMDVHPISVPLSSVADSVEQSFRPVANQKGLEFAVEVSEGTPSTIITDEQRLQQILNNLLSNAFKFTTEGAVKVRIDRAREGLRFMDDRLNRVPDVVAFEVSDTGIGVPEDKLRLIFEAFQQADGTTSRRYGGTGLGLSISREIARLLGGEIHVASETATGSTFTLFLPASHVAAPAAASATKLDVPVTMPGDAGPVLQPGETGPAEELLDLPNDLADDRVALAEEDRSLLVVNHDAATARRWMDVGRATKFKTLGATTADAGYALAREYQPDAILIDADLGDGNGHVLLNRLKLDAATRHIPVYMAADPDRRADMMKAGAATCVEKPATDDAVASLLRAATYFLEREVRNLIVIEDDEVERNAIVELVGKGDDVAVTAVGSALEARREMESKHFDCAVLDLKLQDMSGFDLLEKLRDDPRFRDLPIIIYTGKDLTRKEETMLRRYSDSIIIKDVNSPERLLAETSLFLHRLASALPVDRRQMIEHLHSADSVFHGKKILVVDDDIRNVFALTSILEAKGMDVVYAENGRDGIETLDENPDVDLVLMDIMMPEMDGYETTRAIRSQTRFESLPIIALTAKAMKGDREKTISAGASDYITKPVDPDQLLSLMRVWLYQ